MPVRYEEVSEQTYGAAFAATCTATPNSRGVILDGACPRCADLMTFPHVTTVFKTGTVPGSRPPPPIARRSRCSALAPKPIPDAPRARTAAEPTGTSD